MTSHHPFQVGGRYRNSFGAYEVLAIDGNSMTVRYDDGREQTLKLALQAQIWQSIRDHELGPAAALKKSDFTDDSQETAPVRELVAEVLRAKFAAPYPANITDQVCLAIESSPDWLRRYHELVEHFSRKSDHGKDIVNNSIGSWTKDLTGMVTVKAGVPSQSGLIQSYSRQGYPGQGE